jgi:hypothetical protein
MEFKSNCFSCGEELIYLDNSEPMLCLYCGQSIDSNSRCRNGHFICDHCHSLKGVELISRFCVETKLSDPIEMAMLLMRDERIKMHGPEHHFLVPAVLLAACYVGNQLLKTEKIKQAQNRSKNVLGGFCGFYGACGAAVGTGIAVSLITGANPLSIEEWKLSNLMTATSLKRIAEHGGPRCCKRDTFLALLDASDFLAENLNIKLIVKRDIKCEFGRYNKECTTVNCAFYHQQ